MDFCKLWFGVAGENFCSAEQNQTTFHPSLFTWTDRLTLIIYKNFISNCSVVLVLSLAVSVFHTSTHQACCTFFSNSSLWTHQKLVFWNYFRFLLSKVARAHFLTGTEMTKAFNGFKFRVAFGTKPSFLKQPMSICCVEDFEVTIWS